MILFLTMFTVCISLFTATLEAQYRDVNFIVQAISRLWFYATPIVYFINLIPHEWQILFAFNPLSLMFMGFQQMVVQMQLPLFLVISNLTLSLVIMTAGILCFYKLQSSVVDHV